tara:strand:+ start:667 stop:972 length:306 start_codon:yes stop_codon:yes gene_type:complete
VLLSINISAFSFLTFTLIGFGLSKAFFFVLTIFFAIRLDLNYRFALPFTFLSLGFFFLALGLAFRVEDAKIADAAFLDIFCFFAILDATALKLIVYFLKLC